jgi:hypothetical protein
MTQSLVDMIMDRGERHAATRSDDPKLG